MPAKSQAALRYAPRRITVSKRSCTAGVNLAGRPGGVSWLMLRDSSIEFGLCPKGRQCQEKDTVKKRDCAEEDALHKKTLAGQSTRRFQFLSRYWPDLDGAIRLGNR